MLNPHYANLNIKEEKNIDVTLYLGAGLHKNLHSSLCDAFVVQNIEAVQVGEFNSTWNNQIHKTLSRSKLFVGSMGMVTYEAIACGAYPIVVCRSEDHMEAAERLVQRGLAINCGIATRPTKENSPENILKIVKEKLASYITPYSLLPILGQPVDGKGLYRVAREILKDV